MVHKFLFAALALGLCISAHAKDKLTITEKEGTSTQLELAGISEITFDGNRMVIANGETPLSFDTSDIDEITFQLTLTGIECISAPLSDGLTISADKGLIRVVADDDMPIHLGIFDLKGRVVVSLSGSGAVQTDTSSLPAGIYIIRANGKTVKYIR